LKFVADAFLKETRKQLHTTALQSFEPTTLYEPGSSVPEADAMSTAPRRQG
jgi:hypothetical protein